MNHMDDDYQSVIIASVILVAAGGAVYLGYKYYTSSPSTAALPAASHPPVPALPITGNANNDAAIRYNATVRAEHPISWGNAHVIMHAMGHEPSMSGASDFAFARAVARFQMEYNEVINRRALNSDGWHPRRVAESGQLDSDTRAAMAHYAPLAVARGAVLQGEIHAR